MPRSRPLAIACAKLAVVRLFLVAFTSVGHDITFARGSGDGG
jgi:hypothetical protein